MELNFAVDVDAIKYNVTIYWKSPFNTLERRVGYFEEYTEAEEFSKYLNDKYSKFDMPYAIYLNTHRAFDNKIKEFYEFITQ